MKTYSQLVSQFCAQASGTTQKEIDQAKSFISDSINYVLSCYDWDRTEITTVSATQLFANQADYDLPSGFKKMNGVRLLAVNSWPFTQIGFYIDKNRTRISIYPTPGKDGDFLEFTYSVVEKDLTLDDYTAGTVATVTNGSKTVTFSGTTLTNQMVGSWFKVADSWSAGGDGNFYQIESVVNSTTLTLTRAYLGNSATGAFSYLIGQVPVMNPDFITLVNFKALQLKMIKDRDFPGADRYEKEFETRLMRMKSYERSKTTSGVASPGGIFRNRI